MGLPVITADVEAENGDLMSVDLEKGIIVNMTTGKKFEIQPFDQFMIEILNNGGLVNHYLKTKEKV